MEQFNPNLLSKLYKPPVYSHKGQNGKLMIIGGSKLFHAASLWALKVASRIVDMVYYSSVDENNQIVQKAKEEFRDGIVVRRDHIEDYIQEADCVLIGPGLPRLEGQEEGDDDTKALTESLLKKYTHKKWVIDGGSLQTIDPSFIPKDAILTPHQKELETLFHTVIPSPAKQGEESPEVSVQRMGSSRRFARYRLEPGFAPQDDRHSLVAEMAKKYNCTILLKGAIDTVCNSTQCAKIKGGNAGMTKGGTGDVLAGLTASIYCKNEAFLSACAGSFINKKAGDFLYQNVGPYFNASDLTNEIPKIMKRLLY